MFLSFAEYDHDTAKSLVKEPLESRGYKVCWHHETFIPGHSIYKNMETFIFSSQFIILLLSDAFMKSKFCMKELQIAMTKGTCKQKYVIPVKLSSDAPVPLMLKDLTYIMINDRNFMNRIGELLGKSSIMVVCYLLLTY